MIDVRNSLLNSEAMQQRNALGTVPSARNVSFTLIMSTHSLKDTSTLGTARVSTRLLGYANTVSIICLLMIMMRVKTPSTLPFLLTKEYHGPRSLEEGT